MKYEETKKSTKYEVRRNERSSILQTSDFTLQKGVSLYLALIIMFILIAIGLGVSLIIVSQMKMIRGMGDSVVAFYAADTGIEHSLYDKKNGGTGVVSGSVGGADYDVTSPVANTYRSKGSFANVKRAIEIYAPGVPPPTTVVEPRYMRSDNVLGTSESGALTELFIDMAPQIYIGIKVYVLKADGSEIMVYGTNNSADAVTGLTAGPAARTTTVSASFTVQNDVFLASTDSIKVVVLADPSSPPSTPLATFTTEQLGAFKLNAATWTVYYRLRRTAKVGSLSQFYFRFGIAGDDSYIDNFTWSH